MAAKLDQIAPKRRVNSQCPVWMLSSSVDFFSKGKDIRIGAFILQNLNRAECPLAGAFLYQFGPAEGPEMSRDPGIAAK